LNLKIEAQVEQGLRTSAKRELLAIVTVGFNMTSAVEKRGERFPNINFTLIDGVIDSFRTFSLFILRA